MDFKQCSKRAKARKGRRLPSAIILVGICMLVMLGACSSSSLKQERKIYSGQSAEEGNIRAQNQGQGLNGPLLEELEKEFSAKGIKLMNTMTADDGQGGVAYMALLDGDGRHVVKVHIFRDAGMRASEMYEMVGHAGDQANVDNVLGHTTMLSKGHVAMVYTAGGGERDRYEKEVLDVFHHVLDQIH
ncbi:hypothetical protein [Paenibacillus sp. JJ-223]|uniref:hypothetical protein n=1 Tax=Paenibacillus sp. JJ-223 TaxID=2905647 RepID=UPI001F236775|nr:hypothetical protein [Paenibacillus sp. JJ-223]CAH1211248.1 hypothetical protein PAECIP111890_03660 [Paenibacillus sp. JJ-223]